MALNWNQFFHNYVSGHYQHITPSHASYASFFDFYRALKRVAADALEGTGSDSPQCAPEDLVHEFLADVERTGNVLLNSEAGVKKQMRRLFKKLNDPASAEVWNICREALLKLQKDKNASMRKTGTQSTAEELWWSTAPAAAEPPCERNDDSRFVKALREIEHLPPPENEGRKLVSPTRALAFVADLLEKMGCPLQMRLIHEAMCRKTSLLSVVRILKGNGADDDRDVYGEDERPSPYITKILERQISERGALIGERLCKDKLCFIYVGYFYPKYALGNKVTLAEFGQPQRVAEKSARISLVLATYLPDLVNAEYLQDADHVLSREECESYKLHMTLEERIAFNFCKETLRRQAVDAAEKHCRHHCKGVSTAEAHADESSSQ